MLLYSRSKAVETKLTKSLLTTHHFFVSASLCDVTLDFYTEKV